MTDMNRLAHHATAKALALLGALAIALAPLQLFASCLGGDCGCGAVDDASKCCNPDLPCTAAVCCPGIQGDSPFRAHCACSQSVPATPAEPRTHLGQRNELQPAAVFLDFPLAAEIQPALTRPAAWDEYFSPVPARVLFCVWRN